MTRSIAVLYKRGWVGEPACRGQLVAFLSELFASPAPAHHILAVDIMEASVQQFTPARASDMAQSLAFHAAAAAAFQAEGLLHMATLAGRVLTAAGQSLAQALQPGAGDSATLAATASALTRDTTSVRLVARAAQCLHRCLGWDFAGRGRGGGPGGWASGAHPPVEPPSEWRELLGDGTLLTLALRLHSAGGRWVRPAQLNVELATLIHALLALRGSLFPSDPARAAYTEAAFKLLFEAGGAPPAPQALPSLPQDPAAAVRAVAAGFKRAAAAGQAAAVAGALQSLAGQERVLVAAVEAEAVEAQFLAGAFATLLLRIGPAGLATAPAARQYLTGIANLAKAWLAAAADSMHLTAQCEVQPVAGVLSSLSSSSPPTHSALCSLTFAVEQARGQLQEAADTLLGSLATLADALTAPGMPLSGVPDASAAACRALAPLGEPLAEAAGDCVAATLESRLSAAMVAVEAGLDDDVPHDDGSVLSEHALAVASLIRASPRHSLPLLLHAIAAATEAVAAAAGQAGGAAEAHGALAAQYERLWWLVTYAGFALADSDEGETPTVPGPLNALSARLLREAAGGGSGSRAGMAAVSRDPLVMLPLHILSIGQLEGQRCAAAGTGAAPPSPLLCQRLLWFLSRWAPTYLMPDADLYRSAPLSFTLTRCFAAADGTLGGEEAAAAVAAGGPTALVARGGQGIAEVMLQVAVRMLACWTGEDAVAEEAVGVLAALTRAPGPGTVTVPSDAWAQLFNTHVSHIAAGGAGTSGHVPSAAEAAAAGGAAAVLGRLRFLPNALQCRLTTLLCNSTKAVPPQQRVGYLLRLLTPLQQRMSGVLGAADFRSSATAPRVVEEVRRLLAHAIGVAKSQPAVPLEVFSPVCASLVETGGALLDVYRVEGPVAAEVLEFVRVFLDAHLQFMPLAQAVPLLRASLALIQAFVRHKVSGTAATAQGAARGVAAPGTPLSTAAVAPSGLSAAQEEEDTELVMQVLSILEALVTKDDMDWGDTAGGSGVQASFKAAVGDIVTLGTHLLTVLMTPDRLAQPPVCTAFLGLCRTLAANQAARLLSLPSAALEGFLRSLMFGVTHVDRGVQLLALQAVADLFEAQVDARTAGAGGLSAADARAGVQKFLPAVLQSVIPSTVVSGSVISAASACVLTMALVDGEAFSAATQQVAQSWASGNSALQQHLATAFGHMVQANGVDSSTSARNQRAFQVNFERFLKDARAHVTTVQGGHGA